jgi:hypothetical protein
VRIDAASTFVAISGTHSAWGNVVTFPRNRFTREDLNELRRWNDAASQADGWFVQTLSGTDGMIECTDAGDEYAVITHGAPDNDAVLLIEPHRGQWVLTDRRGRLVNTFGTLIEALETVSWMVPELVPA